MSMGTRLLLAALLMAGITYLIRAVPFALFRRRIQSRFVQEFFSVMPYAVLGAMTFPDILTSTASLWSALAGLAAAGFLAWREKSLPVVALAASGAVFCAEWALRWCGML